MSYVDPVDLSPLRDDGDALVSPSGRRYPRALGGFDLRPGAGDDNKRLQADIYDQMLGELSDFDHPHNLTLVHQRGLLDRLVLRHGDPVLEIGGHRSGTLPYLERHKGVVGHGLDISPVWVRAHNALARARQSATTWVLGDAEHLPFATGSMAAVVAFDVFEHLSHLDEALRGVARVLAPGGMLVCHMPVRDIGGSLDGLSRRRDPAAFAARQASVGHFHERMPRRSQVRTKLEAAGLDVLDVVSFNAWVQPIHDHRILPLLGRLRHRGAASESSGEPAALPRQAASGFQRAYAATVVPVARLLAWPDQVAVALGVGGSCSFVARKGQRAA